MDDKRAAMVERVLGCFPDDGPAEERHAKIALRLIRAEVLEEAARVAGPSPDHYVARKTYYEGRKDAAAAIRALKAAS